MKTIFRLLLLLFFVNLYGCQETSFGPTVSPENGVLSIQFEGQRGNATITMVPSLETKDSNMISLSLVPGTDYTHVILKSLVLSDGALSSLNVGDTLDLTLMESFEVTALNGFVRKFYIKPPEKFNLKNQGPLITDGAYTLTVGEWLCLGQNRKFDIDPITGDTVGFFRCNASNGQAPQVDNTGSTVYLKQNAGDKDNYFIFRSNGTYEYSYGIDGLSSSIDGNATYKGYLTKASKGYWTVIQSKRYNASPAVTSWGLLLTDSNTGTEFTFNYIQPTGGDIVFLSWPLNNQSLRVFYKFFTAQHDEDWSTFVVE